MLETAGYQQMKDRIRSNGNKPNELFPGRANSSKEPAQNAPERVEKGDGFEPAPSVEKAEAHADAQLDKSIELSFPASDPIAAPVMPDASKLTPCRDPMEDMLDEAIALTFPASDPIAVSVYAELVAAAPAEPVAQDRPA